MRPIMVSFTVAIVVAIGIVDPRGAIVRWLELGDTGATFAGASLGYLDIQGPAVL